MVVTSLNLMPWQLIRATSMKEELAMKTLGAYVSAAVFSAAIAMVPAQAGAEAEGMRAGILACKKAGEKISFLIHSRVPLFSF